jgi:hypothetical protein
MRLWDFVACVAPVMVALSPMVACAQEAPGKTGFRVKYIAEGVVYLDSGRAAGLKEGQQLIVQRDVAPEIQGASKPAPPTSAAAIASLQVISVAASSAVCEIKSSKEEVHVGDFARVAPEVVAQAEQEQQEQRLVGGREYPQVITFTGADPVTQEVRDSLPRPPSLDVNRMRGRIGIEYSSILTRDTPSSTSSEIGLVARFDMSRIGGTYWNFDGYWRGRFTTLSGSAAPATVDDLINRTYTLSMEYDSPNSPLVAGGGRLYVPWASSLDTIDGGYFGRKVSDRTIVGIFAGTTPDPTSYDYNPQGKLGGAFVNFQGGSFEDWRYSATFGVAISAIGWQATRQFGFLETSISLRHDLSLYDATEIDLPHTVVVTPGGATSGTGTPAPPPSTTSTGGLNRSYLTLRYQPSSRLELDLNDTYYRDFPSFDPSLIGTGLLDRYLFQGLSGGVRINLPKTISLYTELGKSSATSDANGSWNQLYGIGIGEIWRTGIRADARYSKFNSSFGSGNYKALLLSRELTERLQWQFQAGFQNFNSTLTSTTQTHFIDTDLDWTVGRLIFFEAGYTWQRGGTMNYDQFRFMVGKRF